MLRRELEEAEAREVLRATPEDFERNEEDEELQRRLDQNELDRQTPIFIAAARRLMVEQAQRVSREQLVAAAVECPDLLVVNWQEMLLIGHALKVVDSAIVFEDEYGDEDRYPVYTVEPDPNTLLPYVDLPAEGLKRFAEEQDGRWMIVPKDGVTIDYQVNVRNGMLQLSAGIAELVQPLDEDASLEGISAVRRLYLSEAMVRALGIDSIDTGVLAQANNFTD